MTNELATYRALIEKAVEALKRLSQLTPNAANAANAHDLHLTVKAIADAARADLTAAIGKGEGT